MRGLAGKIVAVAGGGTGIGKGSALRLGEEGASVVVGDLDEASAHEVATAIVASGGSAVGVQFDMAAESGVDTLIRTALDTYGGLDAVHLNAADTSPETIGRDGDIEGVPLEVFDRTIEVNLRGYVLGTRRALPELRARGGGAIVYTASAAAFMSEGTRPSYSISKAGVLALVRHVASVHGPKGIRANAVAPGFVVTEKIAAATSENSEAVREYALRTHPTHRLGRPADVGALVAFLCSDDGEWINGQTISVDGGFTMR